MIFYNDIADENHAYDDDDDTYAWDDNQQQQQEQHIQPSENNVDEDWIIVNDINEDWFDVINIVDN